MTLMFDFFLKIRDLFHEISTSSNTLKKILSIPSLGYMLFRFNLFLKKIQYLRGQWTQRVIEYPWVLSKLSYIEPNSKVLDVGCAESLFSHALIGKYKCFGLDIRDHPYKPRNMFFSKETF
jgi:hypothetical protein